jgi:DNA-binding MarR family transcriptional regulator
VISITDLDGPPQTEDFAALGDLLLDAVLASAKEVLDAAVEELRSAEVLYRRAARGRDDLDPPLARLETLLALATGARDRVPSSEDFALVAPGGRTHQVLQLVRGQQSLRGKDVCEELGLAPAQASRIAADLNERRLIARVKVGREVFLDITPRGEDVLDDIETRRNSDERRARAAAPPREFTPVFYGNTAEAFELETGAVRAALQQSGDPAGRSRALFVTLAATRPDVITDRLLVWPEFARDAMPERIEIRLPAPNKPDRTTERLTWDILETMGASMSDSHTVWPGPAPLWDGWAVIHGKGGKRSIVFLEAKSQPQELKSKPFHVGRSYDKTAWLALFQDTSKFLKAGQSWDLWPDYADPATRLAFIHHLQQLDIRVWWLNLYFVDPKRLLTRLPASRTVWDHQIKAVRSQLQIKDEHPLTHYINHQVVPVPEEGLVLTDMA